MQLLQAGPHRPDAPGLDDPLQGEVAIGVEPLTLRKSTGVCVAVLGVMGALAGILGSMMALEAIREIVGFGEGLVGRLLMVDARAMRFETLRYQRDPQNILNGDALTITDLSGHR